MTPPSGQQIVTIQIMQILPNISRYKGNQAMKFGQLIKYNVRNIFFKNHAENEAGRLSGFKSFFICTVNIHLLILW